MYDLFKWTGPSRRRNMASAEYEPIQPYVLIALASQARCRTFVDVGANVGCYSVFASLIPSVDQIVAFEPNPPAFEQVKSNLALNSITGEVHAKVVSDHDGTAKFGIVSDLAGNNGVTDTAYHSDFRDTIDAESVRLDDFDFVGPVCLKIDVEGHEPAVLAGAKGTLSKPCIVQMEGYCEAASVTLESLGYRRLTSVGPDGYFTNIADIDALAAFEQASQAIIETNHRLKALTLRKGDFALMLSGSTAVRARGLAKKVFGGRL